MRYWALFILRMLARLGLILAIIAWCLPVAAFAAGPISGRQVVIGWFNPGWFVRWSPSGPWTVWEYAARRDQDAADSRAQFDSLYSNQAQLIPGVTYCQANHTRSLLLVDHWLLCLAFLVLTVLTSWRWKKPQAAMEGEDG